MEDNRNYLVFVLAFVLVILGAASVYFGYKLTQDKVPGESDKSVACVQCEGGECPDGYRYEGDDCFQGGTCEDRDAAACAGHEIVDPGNQCPNGQGNIAGCYHFNCDYGCGDDGACEADKDPGVRYAENNCGGLAGCGQVDYYDGNRSYCGIKEINCDGACAGYHMPCWVQGCTKNADCNGALVCQGSRCVNPDCATESDCTCTVMAVEDLDCGSSCDPADDLCPGGHTCNPDTSLCALDSCLADASSCQLDLCIPLDPVCGDPCDPTEADSCSIGHVCDPVLSRCVLEGCEGNPECPNNGCAVPVELPQTGILDDSRYSWVLISLIVFSLGIIGLKADIMAYSIVRSYVGVKTWYESSRIHAKENAYKRDKDKFENKMVENSSN